MPPRLVLCTDLDGTFLGDPGRDRLYAALEAHRREVMLIYATGRSLPDARRVLGWAAARRGGGGGAPAGPTDPPVPQPDFFICDVGTTVYHGAPPHAPIDSVQGWISSRWGEAGQRVREMLQGEAGVELQGGGAGWETIELTDGSGAVHRPCRLSYYYDDACRVDHVRAKVEAEGLDFVASHGRFMDILPGGVGKGTTLLRLLQTRGIDPRLAVVAGDTCNDLSLFRVCGAAGPRGVVVGNAEQALRDALGAAAPGIHVATGHGAAGIWEGLISAFGYSWLTRPPPPAAGQPPAAQL